MSKLQCSQLHFCPEWNDEQNKTKLRQNQPNTSKKMHATSGLIAYMYFSIYIYILDMHNT